MKKFWLISLAAVVCFTLMGCNKQEIENKEQEFGFVEEENVTTNIAKFNTQVMDNNVGNKASDDYFSAENNLYYYGLLDDTVLVVKPVNYTGNKDNDIVDIVSIYYDENSQNESIALEYIKCLIKANSNKNLTDTEVQSFMDSAKEMKKEGKNASNGSGILLGYTTGDGRIQYNVVRNYKVK